jgi:uncharacterized protein YeeX (DUF496 family)
MLEPLKFNPMFHNAVNMYLEQEWGRKLTDHEKHIIAKTHDYVRTEMEVEEIKIVGVVRNDKEKEI